MASDQHSGPDDGPHPVRDEQDTPPDQASEIISAISGAAFDEWYKERQRAENIRKGRPYFNGPPAEQPAKRHSPSKLLRCHRRAYYGHFNSPKETEAPQGIFWIGDEFEHKLAVPFLRDLVADEGEYIRNSVWIDTETKVEGEEVRIRGETDPVVVDEDSTPQLLTEIKTTSGIDHLEGPKQHHRAQIHAYLKGLTEEYDVTLTDAVILYAERESLDVQTFHVEFDPVFWKEIIEWAGDQTAYRTERELPDADPEFGWECQYCPYQTRCGKDSPDIQDSPPKGLVPFGDYPRSQLKDYLDAHEGAKLTPSLAAQHPELVSNYSVRDWMCERCGVEVPYRAVDWDGSIESPPQCPLCSADGQPADLCDPSIEAQWPNKLASRNQGESL